MSETGHSRRQERVVGIIQARISSSRLPGKVLAPVFGKPMLERQVERLKRCALIDELLLATSQEAEDDPVAELGNRLSLSVYRGSLDDVLDRYYRAAAAINAQHIVRLTADCPLADPGIIDELVCFYLDGGWDYAANCIDPTLPDGLDAEVFTFESLSIAWREAERSSEREHVTLFFRSRSDRFKIGNWKYTSDLSGLRWTVDTAADLAFVREVYDRLYPDNPAFSMGDVLALVGSNPELTKINQGQTRNEGLLKSLRDEDSAFTGE